MGKHSVNCNTATMEGIIIADNCPEHTYLFDYLLEKETNLKLPAQFSHFLSNFPFS